MEFSRAAAHLMRLYKLTPRPHAFTLILDPHPLLFDDSLIFLSDSSNFGRVEFRSGKLLRFI
jgi:hypothetical protein